MFLEKRRRNIEALRANFRLPIERLEAHRRSVPVLEDMAADPGFLAAVLKRHLAAGFAFSRAHAPFIPIEVGVEASFSLWVNCWYPARDRETHLSSQPIHHHGAMIVSSATLWGCGYEHWTFTAPVSHAPPEQDVVSLKIAERRPHPWGDVWLLPDGVPHVPFFPPSLSVTAALWSGRDPPSVLDRIKRLRVLRGREDQLRRIARRVGVGRALALKPVTFRDFIPEGDHFRGLRTKFVFPPAPNLDRARNLCHLLQQARLEDLSPLLATSIERQLRADERASCLALVKDLQAGRPIEPLLPKEHQGFAEANFTKDIIELAAHVR